MWSCFFPYKTGTVIPTQLPCRVVSVSWEVGLGNIMQMQESVGCYSLHWASETQNGRMGLADYIWSHWYLKKKILLEDNYNIVMVFSIHQHESAIGIHVFPLSWTPLPPPAPPYTFRLSQSTNFGCPASGIRLIYFTYGNVYVWYF